ncbi:hypothetical protein B0A55_00771, partial [Friedmanniomyces simplex]
MADALGVISAGSLAQINSGNPPDNPVLQCVQIKPMPSPQGQERYRVVMNDSLNFIQCMLAQQSNWVMHEGKLKRGTLVRVKQYQVNFVKDKNILIILDLEVLGEYGELEKLGQPVALEGPKPEADVKPQPGNISGDNMYGNKQQQQPAQQRSLPSRTNGAASGGSSHGNIHPIEALSPYAHRWTIKARCTHKGDIKT